MSHPQAHQPEVTNCHEGSLLTMSFAGSENDRDHCKGESGKKTTVDTNVRHQGGSLKRRLNDNRPISHSELGTSDAKRRKSDLPSASTASPFESDVLQLQDRKDSRSCSKNNRKDHKNGIDRPRDIGAEGPLVGGTPSSLHASEVHEKEPNLDLIWTDTDEIARRRAIRAGILSKHRGNGPQSEDHDSPARDASLVEPISAMPTTQTQETETTPKPLQDNFELIKDSAGSINAIQDEGPSAADYDPDNDRIEEHETQRDLVIDAANAQIKENVVDFEEDDMFADPDDSISVPVSAPGVKAKQISAANSNVGRKLDETMLDSWADVEGYYRIMIGELLDERYAVQAILGKGVFSAVVRAIDQQTGEGVAIKVIRKNDLMKKAGAKEVQILETLMAADPDDRKHIVRLRRTFDHRGHMCLVFESLSLNLREVLKKFGRDIGINLKAVRAYAQQIFLALSLMRRCNIMHADIKPDNILVSESRTLLKICDLGSASDVSENAVTPYLASRFYRAPEVILGLPYDAAMDVWAIGCTLYEMYTGKILFPGRSNNQMLRLFMECRGRIPQKLLRKAVFTGRHFDDQFNFNSMETDKITGEDIIKVMSLSKPTKDFKARIMVTEVITEDRAKLLQFIDLLERCTDLDPARRISPNDALKHPFLARSA